MSSNKVADWTASRPDDFNGGHARGTWTMGGQFKLFDKGSNGEKGSSIELSNSDIIHLREYFDRVLGPGGAK